ncbi:hypothetical protein QZH41_006142 [Actinostola sp. cb2023]|nr:hypothetical protein QZH41_006142 [Actinostola sp. cb2023]
MERLSKIGDMIVQKLCPQNGGNYEAAYRKVFEESGLLIAYSNHITPNYWTSTWREFFDAALSTISSKNFDLILKMVEEKEVDFKDAEVACFGIQSSMGCEYGDIKNHYVLLKKIQEYVSNPGPVRDLRRHAQVDLSKMIHIQEDNLKHLQLLTSIKKLDENLKASVGGISDYFQGLARFDQGIADADIGFLKGELDKYEQKLRKFEGTLKADIKTAMGLMVGMLTANLAEQSVLLAMKALENSNPLKLIFSGPDVKDTMEQAGKVADAATQLAKGAALLVALDDVAQDSAQLGTAFIGNKKQITSLQTVVVKIRKGDASNIGKDADLFIKEYGSYTLQTDRSSLEKNSALWSAFKDATCDLLNGEVGIAGAVPKAIAGGMLLCEKMEGTLAQFFALREDIFDFQFQLVDAVAAVVRGNLAERLAQNIKGKGDFLDGTQLVIGLFMMQHKLQKAASLYCDVIEYKQLGKRASACSTVNGIFTKENVDALIAYTENAPYNEVEREVDIPTRPQFEGDTGYVDLPALARGEEVIFRLPANDKWLVTYRWTLLGQTTVAFVQSFKLFLPHKEYKTGAYRQQSTTQVIITSIADRFPDFKVCTARSTNQPNKQGQEEQEEEEQEEEEQEEEEQEEEEQEEEEQEEEEQEEEEQEEEEQEEEEQEEEEQKKRSRKKRSRRRGAEEQEEEEQEERSRKKRSRKKRSRKKRSSRRRGAEEEEQEEEEQEEEEQEEEEQEEEEQEEEEQEEEEQEEEEQEEEEQEEEEQEEEEQEEEEQEEEEQEKEEQEEEEQEEEEQEEEEQEEEEQEEEEQEEEEQEDEEQEDEEQEEEEREDEEREEEEREEEEQNIRRTLSEVVNTIK